MSKKKVRRPRKVQVANNNYTIKSRSKAWGKKNRAYGMITYQKDLIEVDETQKIDEMVDTVIHEILHAIIAEYKIDVDGRKEEKWVRLISNGLTDVLQKNPNLMSWIQQKIGE